MSNNGNSTGGKVAYHPFFQQQQKKLEQNKKLSPSPPTPTPILHTPSPPPKNETVIIPSPVEPVPATPDTSTTTKKPRGRPKKAQTIIESATSSATANTTSVTSPPSPPKTTTTAPRKAVAAAKSTRATRATSKKAKGSSTSPEPIVSKKTTLIEHVPAVASGSSPRYTAIVKPKFYSDTLEYKAQQEFESQFDFFGRIPSTREKKKHDHEFSRLDRDIFGNSHVTQHHPSRKSSEAEKAASPYFNLVNKRKKHDSNLHSRLIQDHQAEFFQLGKKLRRPSISKERSSNKKHIIQHLETQAQLEAYLDKTFPYWHTFSSCVILSQLVFNKKNQRQVHQQQPWTDKYRPKSVNGLLGERYNYVYLKDWLHQMKIEPMSAPSSSPDSQKAKKVTKKKKKKKTIHLDEDFNDLSLREEVDNDEGDDDFMPIKKSAKELKQQSMKSNMILITGDHGVGKTASVYTAAEQLGYEVFEINSGSKRSGKEVNSMVGEVSRSHMVSFRMSPFMLQQQKKKEEEQEKAAATKPRKRKLNPYLSSNAVSAAAPSVISHEAPAATTTTSTGFLKNFLRKNHQEPATPKKQQQSTTTEPKQSLILLEEVDILFEEDKAFWTSIIELSQNGKRPIIMTCNDPNEIPFESLCLQVILEMKPPCDAELLPYLWLVCYSEGYIVDPSDLICLMAFLGRDIRQLIQTLELYVKANDNKDIFAHYLGLRQDESLVDMKLKCVPSRVAIDTLRLARCYQEEEEVEVDVMAVDDEQQEKEKEEDLFKIERALEDNAFIGTWLGWKENGNMIQESTQDQINGFTSLEFEDDEESESRLILKDLESTAIVLNSEKMTTSTWNSVLCDGSSRWDEICDAKFNNFDEYTEAISKLLTERLSYQPNEQTIMMEYIPYIQQMISANSKTKAVKTRSKRKRLYLPLSDESVNILTFDRPIIDETEFWIDRLQKLKKESVSVVATKVEKEEEEEVLDIA